jgi:tRNA pseudouridine38-40 synthase
MEPGMNNYKLVIQYDGSRYNGWQRQNDTPNTIQQIINDRINGLVGSEVKLIGAGRTDAGVHAWGQCANFRIDKRLDCGAFRDELNLGLPEDIRVRDMGQVGMDFHARHSAREKCYAYTLDLGFHPNPFLRKYAWRPDGVWDYVKNEPSGPAMDLRQMEAAASILLGTHDFAAFCTDSWKYDSTVKTLGDIHIRTSRINHGDMLVMEFTASGFMYNMVRILAGTLVDVGLGRLLPGDVAHLLESGVRAEGGQMAPAKGLCLKYVKY